VGKAASHAGQTTLYVTPMQGKADTLRPLIADTRAAFEYIGAGAEQFKLTDPWTALMRFVSERIAPTIRPFRPPQGRQGTGKLPDVGSLATCNASGSHAQEQLLAEVYGDL